MPKDATVKLNKNGNSWGFRVSREDMKTLNIDPTVTFKKVLSERDGSIKFVADRDAQQPFDELEHEMKQSIIGIEDVSDNKGVLNLSENLSWNYRDNPHAIIHGYAGSGKTSLLYSIMSGLVQSGVEISYASAYNIDAVALETLGALNHVYSNREDIIQGITELDTKLTARLDILRAEMRKRPLDNYTGAGVPPHFFIIDELSGIADADTEAKMYDVLNRVAQIGRQVGLYLIIATQTLNENVVPRVLLSNLSLRVALSWFDEETGKKLFGSEVERLYERYENLVRRNRRGVGLATVGMGEIELFATPELYGGFNAPVYFEELRNEMN